MGMAKETGVFKAMKNGGQIARVMFPKHFCSA